MWWGHNEKTDTICHTTHCVHRFVFAIIPGNLAINQCGCKKNCSSKLENEEQLLYVACRSNGTQRISVKAMSMHYVIEFARMSKRNSALDAAIACIDQWNWMCLWRTLRASDTQFASCVRTNTYYTILIETEAKYGKHEQAGRQASSLASNETKHNASAWHALWPVAVDFI